MMDGEILKKPPIVEALLEVQWELKSGGMPRPADPYFQLLVGSFYEKIKASYPFYEPLPASAVPDEVTGPIVKHRFRVEKGQWPLIQIGPGIMSVNQTERYQKFLNFKQLAIEAINALYDAHPQKQNLVIKCIKLRYIDAKEVDYSKQNIFSFLREKMHIPIDMPSFLLLEGKLQEVPVGLNLMNSFRCNEPPGIAKLTISTGHIEGKMAVIWNQILKSSDDDVPEMPNGFDKWIDKAHIILDGWFWKLIEGDLKKEFNNEA